MKDKHADNNPLSPSDAMKLTIQKSHHVPCRRREDIFRKHQKIAKYLKSFWNWVGAVFIFETAAIGMHNYATKHELPHPKHEWTTLCALYMHTTKRQEPHHRPIASKWWTSKLTTAMNLSQLNYQKPVFLHPSACSPNLAVSHPKSIRKDWGFAPCSLQITTWTEKCNLEREFLFKKIETETLRILTWTTVCNSAHTNVSKLPSPLLTSKLLTSQNSAILRDLWC